MHYQTLFVICCVVLARGEDYQDSLRKLWNKDSASVIGDKSASVVSQPSRFKNQYGRDSKVPYTYRAYGFKPRAIPLKEEPQVEISNYYIDEMKNKTELLFPGNYLPIAKEKGDASNGRFLTKAIPLITNNEFQRRSLDVDEPIIEKPEDFSEIPASRRSISDMLGIDGDDDDYGEYEEEDENYEERKKNGLKKVKPKKLKKYMLPLLLAYKMKYFALVPVMIAGLVLLIGATGLAGFFFALFAAVMGLQKGSY